LQHDIKTAFVDGQVARFPGIQNGLFKDGGAVIATVVIFKIPLLIGRQFDFLSHEPFEFREFGVFKPGNVDPGVEFVGHGQALLFKNSGLGGNGPNKDLIVSHLGCASTSLRGGALGSVGGRLLIGSQHFDGQRVAFMSLFLDGSGSPIDGKCPCFLGVKDIRNPISH